MVGGEAADPGQVGRDAPGAVQDPGEDHDGARHAGGGTRAREELRQEEGQQRRRPVTARLTFSPVSSAPPGVTGTLAAASPAIAPRPISTAISCQRDDERGDALAEEARPRARRREDDVERAALLGEPPQRAPARAAQMPSISGQGGDQSSR